MTSSVIYQCGSTKNEIYLFYVISNVENPCRIRFCGSISHYYMVILFKDSQELGIEGRGGRGV